MKVKLEGIKESKRCYRRRKKTGNCTGVEKVAGKKEEEGKKL